MRPWRLIKAAPFEYLPKPFDIDKAVDLVRRAAQQATVSTDVEATRRSIPELLGQAAAMQQVFRAVGRLSRSSMTVLITGESGTGKELVARALASAQSAASARPSSRSTRPLSRRIFWSRNCSVTKRAHSPARTRCVGGASSRRTAALCFWTKSATCRPRCRPGLLRVLAEGEFYRVGGQTPVKVDVRVIAATHQDLETRGSSP